MPRGEDFALIDAGLASRKDDVFDLAAAAEPPPAGAGKEHVLALAGCRLGECLAAGFA